MSFIDCSYYINNTAQISKDFIKNFGYIKIGLLIFFILVSVIYQIMIHRSSNYDLEKTLINEYPANILSDGLINGIFGILSVLFLWFSRKGSIKGNIYVLFTIFIIIFSFIIAQETSGFNRFMDKKKIIQGTSIYNKISSNATKTNEYNLEHNGDPFIISSAYLSLTIILIFIFILIFKMIKQMLCAHKLMPFFHICNITKIFNYAQIKNKSLKYILFIFEIIIVIFINLLPSLFISPYLRHQDKESKLNFNTLFIIVIVLSLHIMCQFLGLY